MQKFYKHLFTESRKSSISTKNSKSIFEYSQTLSPLNTLNILKYTNTLFSIVMMSHHLKIKSVKCNKVSSHTFKCVILNIKCRSSKAVLKCQMQKNPFPSAHAKKGAFSHNYMKLRIMWHFQSKHLLHFQVSICSTFKTKAKYTLLPWHFITVSI